VPRLINAVPKYRKHKQSGQAIVTLNGRDHLLGPHGTRVSKQKYDRLIAEWLARDRQPMVADGAGLTIAELAARYWAWSQIRHVRNGRPTPESYKIKTMLQHLLALYADHGTCEFGPRELKVVRQAMIDCGWSRRYVNTQVGVLCRMFKWAAIEGLIPAAVHAALALVDGLRRGESALVRERPRRHGVDDATVEATLAHLPPVVQAMIRLQQATGMRPGEVCILRPCDVDRSGEVWEYRPAEHKTAHRDHERLICIGPRGQEALRPYLLRAADSFCFSPSESVHWHRAERHARRTTPLSCGNVPGSNVAARPRRAAGDRYTAGSYRRAIQRACESAFPAPDDMSSDAAAVAAWRSEHRWSPHQIRHSLATRVRREFDIEAAKAVLGHSATNVTGIYAEVDRQRAVDVAKRIG
jgi:integrase